MQAHLGFVKDMRKGSILLGDTGEYLEFVRQSLIGLFMIRIDHLDLNTFEEAVKDPDMADKLILPDKVIAELEEAFKIENAAALAAEAAKEAETEKIEYHEWVYAGCDKEEPSPRACMHTQQPLSQQETQKLARSNIAIATCGALTFEDSPDC